MALDQALVPEPAVLRIYGWKPAGLSLGYFQKASDYPQDWLDQERLVLVRRVTGGAAILHRHDVTFSLVAAFDSALFRGPVEASYDRLHQAVARGLLKLGAEVEARRDQRARSDSGRAGEPACFKKATRFDLIADGRKLVGSAQRRTRARILHHGSIPLRPNPLAPEAASLEQVLKRPVDFEEVAGALVRGFEDELGIRFQESTISDAEWSRARRLRVEQFGREEWNRRR
jgi:lipoate-protein ligase A